MGRCFLITVVGAWHGWAHARRCQCLFHPRVVGGFGQEDFEGCERLFSFTNGIANIVR